LPDNETSSDLKSQLPTASSVRVVKKTAFTL
jgi:hypothetical protein